MQEFKATHKQSSYNIYNIRNFLHTNYSQQHVVQEQSNEDNQQD